MTAKQIAQQMFTIDWQRVQSDSPYENERVMFLINELEKMDSKQALRLLVFVIEAKALTMEFKDEQTSFSDMGEFKYIEDKLQDYPTDEYKKSGYLTAKKEYGNKSTV